MSPEFHYTISHSTEEDYLELQGGEPVVIPQPNGRVCHIVHSYPGGDGMIVPTRIPIEAMGTQIFEINGRYVEFPVAKVRALHGEPCEARSISHGGHGYDRLEG